MFELAALLTISRNTPGEFRGSPRHTHMASQVLCWREHIAFSIIVKSVVVAWGACQVTRSHGDLIGR